MVAIIFGCNKQNSKQISFFYYLSCLLFFSLAGRFPPFCSGTLRSFILTQLSSLILYHFQFLSSQCHCQLAEGGCFYRNRVLGLYRLIVWTILFSMTQLWIFLSSKLNATYLKRVHILIGCIDLSLKKFSGALVFHYQLHHFFSAVLLLDLQFIYKDYYDCYKDIEALPHMFLYIHYWVDNSMLLRGYIVEYKRN